jgi:hypothetical protein
MSEDKDISLLDKVAPCGLICYTCTGYNQGVIKELSGKLLHYLEGYEIFVKSKYSNDFSLVNNCIKVLNYLKGQNCPGCRNEDHQCQNRNCIIRSCIRKKGYSFCADCVDFPCNSVHEGKEFMELWKNANKRIKEVGIEKYFDENKDKSQYTRFK